MRKMNAAQDMQEFDFYGTRDTNRVVDDGRARDVDKEIDDSAE